MVHRTAKSTRPVALFLVALTIPCVVSFSSFPRMYPRLGAPRKALTTTFARTAARPAARAGGVCMQYVPPPNWTLMAAEAQQRNPEFLFPKPLPANIQMMQKMSPGDYGPDMEGVWQVVKEVGGKTDQDILQSRLLDQGYRSYIIAEDIDRGEVIGCCQINRIQVGGYLYLTDDLILKNLYVKEGYGIGNNLVHAALTRLKPSERAWAIVAKDTVEFNFYFRAGFVGLLWRECANVFPGIVW